MISSGDYALKAETGEDLPTVQITAGLSSNDTAAGKACNNYQRPAGQVCHSFDSLQAKLQCQGLLNNFAFLVCRMLATF